MPRGKPSTEWRWVRYRDGLWIPTRKRIYLYWFKYLQEAENSDEYEVQWNKYRQWGGKKEVMNTKFDPWWEDHWKDLFAVKNRGDKPKVFDITTQSPKAEGIRISLLVWQARNTPPDWTPRQNTGAEAGRRSGLTKRRGGRNLAIARKVIATEKRKATQLWGINPDTALLEQEVQSRVGRYMRNARKTLTNVSEGRFP